LIAAIPRLPPRWSGHARKLAGVTTAAPKPNRVPAVAVPPANPNGGPHTARVGRIYCHTVIASRGDVEERLKFSCPDGNFWCPCMDTAHRGKYACCPKPSDPARHQCNCGNSDGPCSYITLP
jgi:hypothetical protein